MLEDLRGARLNVSYIHFTVFVSGFSASEAVLRHIVMIIHDINEGGQVCWYHGYLIFRKYLFQSWLVTSYSNWSSWFYSPQENTEVVDIELDTHLIHMNSSCTIIYTMIDVKCICADDRTLISAVCSMYCVTKPWFQQIWQACICCYSGNYAFLSWLSVYNGINAWSQGALWYI